MDGQLSEQSKGQLRVTRLQPGERNVGRPAFDTPVGTVRVRHDFDAVWTGTHFVVAAAVDFRIMGRIVDAAGNPSGEPFVIAEDGYSPRMAFNGTHILIVYEGQQVSSLLLTADGRPVTEPAPLFQGGVILQESAAVASDGKRFAAIVVTQFGVRLLIFDANGVRGTETILSDTRHWSIASDGSRYLVVSGGGARLFDTNGNPLSSTLSLPSIDDARRFTAVWTGNAWGIALATGGELHILNVDTEGQSVISRDPIPATTGTIVAMHGEIVASWNAAGGIYVISDAEPVSVAAPRQWLLATATSSTGTLVVWEELGNGRTAIRAGVRTLDGSWQESEISATAIIWPEYLPWSTAIAASDGNEFLVVANEKLFVLDANGRRLPVEPLPLSFHATGIAWNGSEYGLIGVDTAGVLRTALISPSGVKLGSGSIPLVRNPGLPMIASNGDGFYAAWHKFDCYEYPCGPTELAGIALDSSLGLLDSAPRIFSPGDLNSIAGLGTNGRYVLAWSSTTRGIVAAHLSSSGVEESVIAPESGRNVTVTRIGDDVAIGWTHDDFRTYPYVAEFRVATIDDKGHASSPLTLDRDATSVLGSGIAAYADGTMQFLRSSFQTGAPHHGTSRVMLRVGSFALPQRADAPQLSTRTDHGIAHLEWTAPAQHVDGYRVESRIGNGLWNEIDSLIDANRRTLDITVLPSTTYMFRVRAFNDAGLGDYSQPAVVNPGRRRTVR